MKTLRGIYTDLLETEYKYQYNGFVFYFSSNFYLEKFKKNLRDYISCESFKIKNKYNILINLDLYFSICYYKKIEKRGFLIYDISNKCYLSSDIIFGNHIIKY